MTAGYMLQLSARFGTRKPLTDWSVELNSDFLDTLLEARLLPKLAHCNSSGNLYSKRRAAGQPASVKVPKHSTKVCLRASLSKSSR